MKLALLTVAVVISLAATAGCTIASDPPGEPESSPAPSEPRELWSAKATLLGPPVTIGQVNLVYEYRKPGWEELVARDLESGRVLWAERSVAGVHPQGVIHQPATQTIGGVDTVAFLAYTTKSTSQESGVPTVAEALTGKPIQQADITVVSTRPSSCDGTYCVAVTPKSGAKYVAEYAAANRQWTQRPGATSPRPTMALNTGVWIEWNRGGEDFHIRFTPKSGATWRRSFRSIFGPDADPNAGWAWDERTEDGVLIGTAYAATSRKGGTSRTNLTQSVTTGLRLDTGETVWREAGMSPCPPSEAAESAVLMCQFRSGIEISKGKATTWSKIDQHLVRLEPASGTSIWDLQLDNSKDNYGWTHGLGLGFKAAPDPIVMAKGKAIQVDLDSGRPKDLPAAATLLCWSNDSKDVSLRSARSGGLMIDYPSGEPLELCSIDGTRLKGQTPSRESLLLGGYDEAVPAVLEIGSGLVAYSW